MTDVAEILRAGSLGGLLLGAVVGAAAWAVTRGRG